MTLAIGIAGPGYAVLAADSMSQRPGPMGGSLPYLSAEGKLALAEAAGVAFAHSGAATLQWSATAQRHATFEETARALFALLPVRPDPSPREIAALRAANPGEYIPWERLRAQELLMADVETGRLAFLHNQGERFLPESGGIVVAGAAAEWGRDQRQSEQPVPETLEAAIALACRIGRAFIRHVYGGRTLAQFRAAGLVPPVAYPLNLITIEHGRPRRWIFEN